MNRGDGSSRDRLRALLLAATALVACEKKDDVDESAEKRSSSPTVEAPVRFVDVASEAGVDFVHVTGATGERILIETMGSGAVWFDYDQDGDADLYLVQSGPIPGAPASPASNRLYRNDGDWKLVDVTKSAGVGDTGYGMGAAAADCDNDGDLDLIVTNFGPNVFFRNRGDGTFEDATEAAGLGDAGWGTSCAFLDFDLDGHLDLWVVNYLALTIETHRRCFFGKHHVYCSPDEFSGQVDRLYRNLGDGTFEDVTAAAGLRMDDQGKGLGVVVTDIDLDGWPDVYVANDRTPNTLYHNQQDGTFQEIGEISGVAREEGGRSESGMGVDAGDFDGDGDFDLVVTNYQNETNTLYRTSSDLYFVDVTTSTRLTAATFYSLGFGVDFFDMDNDGWLDLMFANGHVLDNAAETDVRARFAQADTLVWNRPGPGEARIFIDVTPGAGPGLQLERVSRGLATADADRDGDLDLVVTNNGGPVTLLRNDGGSRGGWIAIEPWHPEWKRVAVGARVEVLAEGRVQVEELRAGSSYLCQNELRLHFGLGQAAVVERVTVHWPGGESVTTRGLTAGRAYRLTPDGKASALPR